MAQVRNDEIKASDRRWIESSFKDVVEQCKFPKIAPDKFKEEIEA